MSEIKTIEHHQRQIHMDFHTSQFVDDVAQYFNPIEYAKTLKSAHVNSCIVFSKCHNGMSYYPTKVGKMHPALKGRNMMAETIDALHSEGIRAPIYTCIGWEENVAHEHPEWRQMRRDGSFADVDTSADGITQQPGHWKFMNFTHPGYLDYIEAHLLELLDNYPCDGFFIDILFMHPDGDWSEETQKFRRKHNLIKDTAENLVMTESLAQKEFAKRFTTLILSKHPNASIFYNTPNNRYVDGRYGTLTRSGLQTHFEVESLPSGMWGYYHFPRVARHYNYRDKFWLSMTGKFQKMWGDFGGLKPQAALEYECFRSQALGGANSIGDQLHPRGVLDTDTYQTIGNVYEHCELAESFYAGSVAIPEVGIVCPNHMSLQESDTCKSEEGAVLIMEELHYECAVIDDQCDFKPYKLIVLPDSVFITEELQKKLKKHVLEGGKLLLSYKSGLSVEGDWRLPFVPVSHEGNLDLYPSFWQINPENKDCAVNAKVIYSQGALVKGTDNIKTIVERLVPYFKRTDLKFCSHFQTPPERIVKEYPAVLGNEQFSVFADPVFAEYRQVGALHIRNTLKDEIERLIGKPRCGFGLPASVLCVSRRKGNNLIITLLRYLQVRKALDIDIIEEALTFAGELLVFNQNVSEVYCETISSILEKKTDKTLVLPNLKGRLLLEVKNYFGNNLSQSPISNMDN